MFTEKYFRGNGKWAKVSGKRGRWAVALGWNGSFSARNVQIWRVKDDAVMVAKNWLNY